MATRGRLFYPNEYSQNRVSADIIKNLPTNGSMQTGFQIQVFLKKADGIHIPVLSAALSVHFPRGPCRTSDSLVIREPFSLNLRSLEQLIGD